MHWPGSLKPGCSNREMRAETWRALEDLYKKGKGNQGKCRNDTTEAACCRNSTYIFSSLHHPEMFGILSDSGFGRVPLQQSK